MRVFPKSLKAMVIGLSLVGFSRCAFSAEVDLNKQLGLNSSVSVCIFVMRDDTAETLIFKKVEKGYWFKGGTLDQREKDAYRTDNDYCIYPHGKETPAKNPGQSVFPCGASGVIGTRGESVIRGESVMEAGLREFEEETGVNLGGYGLAYKAYALKDSEGPFYVLYCRISGKKELVEPEKTKLLTTIQRNLSEKNDSRRPDALLPARRTFEPPTLDDELDTCEFVSLRGAAIETNCERSRLAYKHLVKMDNARPKPKKEATAVEAPPPPSPA